MFLHVQQNLQAIPKNIRSQFPRVGLNQPATKCFCEHCSIGSGRCVPGQSARQYEGQGPRDLAAFTGTPGGIPMAFVRCYTGTDGQSHFEDLDLLPPDMERSIEQAASSITFTRSPNGRFSDWHNAPRRQYAIFLSGGQIEVVIGDGTTRRFGPGDTVLFEDLMGQGHTSRSVGGERLTAIVPLTD